MEFLTSDFLFGVWQGVKISLLAGMMGFLYKTACKIFVSVSG